MSFGPAASGRPPSRGPRRYTRAALAIRERRRIGLVRPVPPFHPPLSPIWPWPGPHLLPEPSRTSPGVALRSRSSGAGLRWLPIEDVHEPNPCSQPTMVVVAAVTGRDDFVLLGVARAVHSSVGAEHRVRGRTRKSTYQANVYQCRQAHTSIVTWEPINTPALWLNIGADTGGGGGGGGDTQAPTAPRNVRVTGTTSSSVSLAWDASTDNVGVTRYDIVQNAATLTGSAATTFTSSGLSAFHHLHLLRSRA